MKKNALRGFASKIKRQVKEKSAHLGRKFGFKKNFDWESSLINDELSFWEKALAEGGKNWDPAEFQQRTNSGLPLQHELRELISPRFQAA